MCVVHLPGVKISFPLMLDINPLANTEVGYYGEALRRFNRIDAESSTATPGVTWLVAPQLHDYWNAKREQCE